MPPSETLSGNWRKWLQCSVAHYHISPSSIRHGSADTHKGTSTMPPHTHSLPNQPIRHIQHSSGRGGGKRGLMRGWGSCKAMLPGYWWAICRVTYSWTHTHSLYQWALPQLLWQSCNSYLWIENRAVCQRLSCWRSHILQRPIWASVSLLQTDPLWCLSISFFDGICPTKPSGFVGFFFCLIF